MKKLMLTALLAVALQTPALANQRTKDFVARHLDDLGIETNVDALSADKLRQLEVALRIPGHDSGVILKQRVQGIIADGESAAVNPQLKSSVDKALRQVGFDPSGARFTNAQYSALHNARTRGTSDRELYQMAKGFQGGGQPTYTKNHMRTTVLQALEKHQYDVPESKLTDAVVAELFRLVVFVDLSTGKGRFEKALEGLDARHSARAR